MYLCISKYIIITHELLAVFQKFHSFINQNIVKMQLVFASLGVFICLCIKVFLGYSPSIRLLEIWSNGYIMKVIFFNLLIDFLFLEKNH